MNRHSFRSSFLRSLASGVAGLLLCALCVLAPGGQLWAQQEGEPVMLLDTSMLIPRLLGVREVKHYFPEKGTVIFKAEVLDKPLLQMEVKNTVTNRFVYSSAMFERVEDSVRVEAHDRLRFRFRNGSFSFRYVHLTLYHLKDRPEAPRVYRDTVVETVFGPPVEVEETKHITVYFDSLSLHSALVDSLRIGLSPAGDPGGSSLAILEVDIPAEYEHQRVVGWAYWIGTGPGAWAHFEENARQIPEAWRQRGVSDPLHAFARGLIPEIPAINTGPKVAFAWTDSATAVAFRRGADTGIALSSGIVNYGKTWLHPPSEQKQVLCLQNPYSGTALSVYVKVVLIHEKLRVRERARRLENR